MCHLHEAIIKKYNAQNHYTMHTKEVYNIYTDFNLVRACMKTLRKTKQLNWLHKILLLVLLTHETHEPPAVGTISPEGSTQILSGPTTHLL